MAAHAGAHTDLMAIHPMPFSFRRLHYRYQAADCKLFCPFGLLPRQGRTWRRTVPSGGCRGGDARGPGGLWRRVARCARGTGTKAANWVLASGKGAPLLWSQSPEVARCAKGDRHQSSELRFRQVERLLRCFGASPRRSHVAQRGTGTKAANGVLASGKVAPLLWSQSPLSRVVPGSPMGRCSTHC
jgi:hypothetical protein